MALRFMNIDEPQIVFDPVAVPPPAAARARTLLRRMICARDHGCDIDGTPYPAGDDQRDYLLDGINAAEALLRPHAAGLLSLAEAR